MASRMAPPRITLLTDFGTADGYVAAMKGVIAATLPAAIIDDAAHDIPPGDIHAAAWALGAYWRLYPTGTVHIVVVDPGVGTDRRAVVFEADGRFVVAPDNGVASYVLREAMGWQCVEIAVPGTASATFHGRDVLAPVAARIAGGALLESIGSRVADPVTLSVDSTSDEQVDGLVGGTVDRSVGGTADGPAGVGMSGAVVHIDRFGNLITDIAAAAVSGGGWIEVGGRRIRVVRTYADVASGEAAALVGSRGVVEVAVRDGSAAVELGVGRGARITTGPGTGYS